MKISLKIFKCCGLLILSLMYMINVQSFAETNHPHITRPKTNEVYSEESVRFVWTDIADEYIFSLIDVESNTVIKEASIRNSNITFNTDVINFGQEYEFQVAALHEEGISEYDTMRIVLKRPILVAPEVHEPDQDDEIRLEGAIQFKWEDIDYKYSYSLYDITDSEYVINESRTYENSVQISSKKLNHNHHYMFAINTIRGAETSEVNEVYFTCIPRKPNRSDIRSPEQGETFNIDDTVKIRWERTEKNYRYILSDEDTGEPIISGTTSKTHIDFGNDTLEHGKTYEFKVYSLYEGQESSADSVKFEIEYEGAEPPTIKSPRGGKRFDIGDSIKVLWSDTESKYQYRVIDTTESALTTDWTITPYNEVDLDYEIFIAGHEYQIDICSIDGKNVSETVSTSFSIDPFKIDPPKIKSPTNRDIFDTEESLYLNWRDTCETYEVSIYDDTIEKYILKSQLTTLSGYRVEENQLDPGHWYEFQVVGYMSGYRSKVCSVDVYGKGIPQAMSINYPANNGVYIVSEDEPFTWKNTSYEYRYSLEDITENDLVIENRRSKYSNVDLVNYLEPGHEYKLTVWPDSEHENTDCKDVSRSRRASVFRVVSIAENHDEDWFKSKMKNMFRRSDDDDVSNLSYGWDKLSIMYFQSLLSLDYQAELGDKVTRDFVVKMFHMYRESIERESSNDIEIDRSIYYPFLNSFESRTGSKYYYLDEKMSKSELLIFIGRIYGLGAINTKKFVDFNSIDSLGITHADLVYMNGAMTYLSPLYPINSLDEDIEIELLMKTLIRLTVLEDNEEIKVVEIDENMGEKNDKYE